MKYLLKHLIFSIFVAVAFGRSFPIENTLELLQETNCSCDWRYLKHYATKGCLVEKFDSCGCPENFICPLNQTQQAPSKVCTYQNKNYKVGSKIITSDPCQVCRCRDRVPPYISCVTRECPSIDDTIGKDCHLIYTENKCCPVGVECLKNESEVTVNQTCEYNGRFYPFGSKINPTDDPCQICICDENWNGIDNSSCYQQDCLLEKNKSKLDAGCIPVYHESRCCPIEFYCPFLSDSLLNSNESSESYNISNGNQCIFGDELRALGEELFIDNPCVKCSCITPPDFTCVHQTCPPPPSKENCYANFFADVCCPTYDCMLGDAESNSEGCPTPLCADSSCRIETPPGHECPTCVCGENTSELEHNNLEQVQQISQNFEQLGQEQQVFEPYQEPNDYSDDELQMMPIRMQDSEGQISVLERMVLPEMDNIENQYDERLVENSFENNHSSEAVTSTFEEIQDVKEENSSIAEHNFENSHVTSVSNQSENVQKRSDVSDAVNEDQPERTAVDQKWFIPQESQEFNEDIEREGNDSAAENGSFDDELESFKNRMFDKNKTIINEIFSINHVVKVPAGCPTPMCEGPWCKIGILPGEKCPTCICKRHSEP